MPLLFNTLSILFALLTGGAYWYGVQESLFWIYPWYDIMLHLLGGLVIGFWASAVAARLKLKPISAFFLIIVTVVGGAIMWEVFEYVIGFEQDAAYVVDTTADLLNGLIGGFATALFYILLYKPEAYVE
jgi:hypothetical protein